MPDRPQLGVARLLPSLCALFIVNGAYLYSEALRLIHRFLTFTAGWDTLVIVLLGLLLGFGALTLVSFYARALFRTTIRVPYYFLVAAVAIDAYHFERPLAVYGAALWLAVQSYQSYDGALWLVVESHDLTNTRLRTPRVIGLLTVPLVVIVGYSTPLRFLALGCSAALLVAGIAYAIRNGKPKAANFFSLPKERIPTTDMLLDCLYFLTIGAFAWSQAVEVTGPVAGTSLFLTMAVFSPLALHHALVVPVTAVVLRPQEPTVPRQIHDLGDFIMESAANGASAANGLVSRDRWGVRTRPRLQLPSWEAIHAYLSASPFETKDEDGELVRESEHLFLGIRRQEENGAGLRGRWPHPTEQQAQNEPVLLDRKIVDEHIHILGRSGSGKTSLGIIPLLTQLIRGYKTSESGGRHSDPHPIVIIDLKGDAALFNTAREEAAARGQKFLFFTAEMKRPSYFFNPFAAFQNTELGIPTVTQSLMDALNLNHGEGYGRSYFTRISRQRLMSTLIEKGPPSSFQDLYQKLTEGMRTERNHADDAFELQAAIEAFLLYPQLFTTAEQERDHPDSIINFDRVLEERQVVYFWLKAATQSMAAREIGKLALFNLFAAANRRQDEHLSSRQVYLFIDEFQRLVGENLTVILEQARSSGIGTILSNHSAAQLRTADGKDLWPLINGNTAATIHFGSKELQELDMLSRLSGEVLEERFTYSQTRGSGSSRKFGEWDSDSSASSQTVSATSHYVPRLMVGDLQRIFSKKRNFVLSTATNSGLSRFDGAPVVVEGVYTTDYDTYSRRKRERWPDGPALPKGVLESPKTAFVKTRPSKEMLDKIRLLTEEH